MSDARGPYPSDCTDDEWAFVAPYLALVREDAPQRGHRLRDAFDALRWLVRAGAQWRYLPNDFPPWQAVYQQARRWLEWKCFEAAAADLRLILRLAAERGPDPTGAVLDSRTLQSTPESGARAGYDGAKRRKGSKVHLAVDTLGLLLALKVTPADAGDREQVGALAEEVRRVTGGSAEVAFVDQGYTGPDPAGAAGASGIRLEVVKHTEAKRGFVLLPRRWVVERTTAWAARSRRLARDFERLAEVLAGWHWAALVAIMLRRVTTLESS